MVSADAQRGRCPHVCPLHVEHRGDGQHCDFHCVEASSATCSSYDPEATVADLVRGLCRPCMTSGCRECLRNGTDACRVCADGYTLMVDGSCQSDFWWGWVVSASVVLVVVVILVVWVADLAWRPPINEACLNQALDTRSRAKLRHPGNRHATGLSPMDAGGKSARELWPVSTNLCKTSVAGPGLVLSFNFQAAVILWGVVIGLAWVILGFAVDTDIFVMGAKQADTPRQSCIIVSWGHEAQMRLLWAKVGFIGFCYVFTFVGSLLFSVRQLRIFQRMDVCESTHKDFCAVVSGMCDVTGADECVEEELKAAIQKATGQSVVAVSVAWIFQHVEDAVMGGVEDVLVELEHKKLATDASEDFSPFACSTEWGTPHRRPSGIHEEPELKLSDDRQSHGTTTSQSDADAEDPRVDGVGSEGMRTTALRTAFNARAAAGQRMSDTYASGSSGAVRSYQTLMKRVEKIFLSKLVQKVLSRGRHKGFPKRHRQSHDKSHGLSRRSSRITTMMQMEETSADLARRLKASGTAFAVFGSEAARNEAVEGCDAGVEFRGTRLSLTTCSVEPDSVHWENFVEERPFGDLRRFALGAGCILLALTAWVVFFYLPFTWVSLSASYTYGVEPAWYSVLTFSMVVVIGNAIMYTTCSALSDKLCFRYHKNYEICYILLYTMSCTFNVLLDMIVTYCVAFLRLEGSGIRTYDGHTMSELPTVVKRVMAYGMQRELGTNLKEYSFPGTFLIPFLLEPIVAVYLPWQIITLVVRARRIGITAAEEFLRSTPYDLSRYADIHLNVILAVLILFFPGGYNMHMFFGLAASHIWIYLYDHFRALRFSPAFVYASMDVDFVAQWMFSLPCAFLLAAFLFKLEIEQDFALTKAAFGPKLGDPEVSSTGVVLLLCLACLVHVAVHTWLLKRLVPLFGITPAASECPGESYRECAERLACSFITANPVHCLRSRYIHKHDPPIAWCMKGKEHLMEYNPEVGQHFQDGMAETETYKIPDWVRSPKAMFQTVYRRMSRSSVGPAQPKSDEASEQPGLQERSKSAPTVSSSPGSALTFGRQAPQGLDLEDDPPDRAARAEQGAQAAPG